MNLPPEIAPIEIIWTIVAVFGLYFAVRLTLRGRRWSQAANDQKIDDPRLEVARSLVFRGSVKCTIFLACLFAGLDAMTRPQINTGSSVSGAIAVIVVEGLTMVLVVYDEIMHRRIVNALDRYEGVPLHMPSAWERFK